MALETGTRLPDAALIQAGADGPEELKLSDWLAGRKVVLFALPGAYTGICSSAHVPSFIRVAEDLQAEGVEEIACLSVNDPFVMKAWGEATGAAEAGITMLCDAAGELTRALGMEFDLPSRGLIGRSNRYVLLLDDGEIMISQIDKPGVCEMTTGETLLETMRGS